MVAGNLAVGEEQPAVAPPEPVREVVAQTAVQAVVVPATALVLVIVVAS